MVPKQLCRHYSCLHTSTNKLLSVYGCLLVEVFEKSPEIEDWYDSRRIITPVFGLACSGKLLQSLYDYKAKTSKRLIEYSLDSYGWVPILSYGELCKLKETFETVKCNLSYAGDILDKHNTLMLHFYSAYKEILSTRD
jgi:hypothetical protein